MDNAVLRNLDNGAWSPLMSRSGCGYGQRRFRDHQTDVRIDRCPRERERGVVLFLNCIMGRIIQLALIPLLSWP